MFTGIVTGLGQILAARPIGADAAHGKRLSVQVPGGYLDDVQTGDSIALNGACMTVASFDASTHRFEIDISAESLDKTAGLDRAGAVNLEKSLRAHDRLGGHIVSGHVDGIGTVTHFAAVGESWELRIATPPELARFIAYKGSITVNGVSLTVNRVIDSPADASADVSADGTAGGTADRGGCELSINLIPHTLENTTLGGLQVGQAVNLEIDMIARYVARMLELPAPR